LAEGREQKAGNRKGGSRRQRAENQKAESRRQKQKEKCQKLVGLLTLQQQIRTNTVTKVQLYEYTDIASFADSHQRLAGGAHDNQSH
jgi:hypothetical protein